MSREISSHGFEQKPKFTGKDTIPRPVEWATGPGPEKGTIAAGERMKEGALERSSMIHTLAQREVRNQLKRYFDAENPKAQVALEKAVDNLAREITASIRKIETTIGPTGNTENMTSEQMKVHTSEMITKYIVDNQLDNRSRGPSTPDRKQEGSKSAPLEMLSEDEEEDIAAK